MPFPLIPAALGVCFLLVWVFIGGMIFRDSQLAAEIERDADLSILPLLSRRPTRPRRHQDAQASRWSPAHGPRGVVV